MTHLYAKYIQPEDVNGLPLAGAKLYFYDAGTTNLINVYQDYNSVTPHANPVVADATGLFAPIWVGAAPYKTILKTSADVTIQTIDNIIPGNVPTSTTDNAIARFDGTSGALQNSAVTIADTTGNTTWPSGAVLSFAGNVTVTHASGRLTNSADSYAVHHYSANGTVSAPGFGFSTDGNTGFYLIGSGTIGVASNAVLRATLGAGFGVGVGDPGIGNSAALTQFLCGDGAVGAPAYVFTSDPDTGFYRVGSGTIGFSSNATLRATFGAGLLMGAATGGDKGAGSINAVAVYDDNVLLTCYPFEAYLDGGKIDEEKWDAKVPDRVTQGQPERRVQRTEKKRVERVVTEVIDGRAVERVEVQEVDEPVVTMLPVVDDAGKPVREMVSPELRDEKGGIVVKAVYRQKTFAQPVYDTIPAVEPETEVRTHEGMRKFKARLGTDTDPLDLEKYIAHWKAKRHLTALPNEDKFDPEAGLPTGAWIQRLIETVEIQAIHIAQLHDRLKAGGL